MDLEPGTQIGGLKIERELGRGAYGVVYAARDILIGRRVALKVIPGRDGGGSEEARAQILAEGRLVGNLNSPNIVTLYRLHAGDDGGWMQEMEYVEGGALADKLAEGKPLPLKQAVRVFRGVCLALKAAHASRVIHGDIKPANVLFGDGDLVKLADFGLGRMLEGAATAVDLHGQIVGTPHYMAPEVIGGETAGMASDVWSTGVLFYQLLTGRVPFPAVTFTELSERVRSTEPDPLGADVPGPLTALLSRCLAKDAAARPAAAAVVEELDRIVAGDASIGQVAVAHERPTNLGVPVSSFVGREDDIEALGGMLSNGAALVTLTGPGGVGKTRLSQELCRRLLDRFEGGCWFADLSDARGSDAVAHAVAQALGVRPSGTPELAEAVAGVLQYRKPLLLVLDNFEQVLDHAPATVGLWMRRAPHVRYLITSRALLGLAGEKAYDLPPLSTPSIVRSAKDPAATAAHAAARLFVERAREAKPGFTLDESNAADVARICAELDGMPLAIELAAARVGIMQPAQIARKLGQKRNLLRSSRRDVAVRQRTLDDAIDWSFHLLTGWEKAAFLQASCFREGFSLESAEAVIDLSAFDDAPAAIDVAQSLRDKSLLTAHDTRHERRLGMYRAIREFAERRWLETADTGQQAELSRRHAEHYVAYAEEWNGRIFGRDGEEALDRVDAEVGNLARAEEWGVRGGDGMFAARAALAVAEAMRLRRPGRQLVPLLDDALAALPPDAATERVRLKTHLSRACQRCGEWDRALVEADEAVSLARGGTDRNSLMHALLQQGEMRRNRGNFPGALACYSESEAIAQAAGDRRVLGSLMGSRGAILLNQGQVDAAWGCFGTAEALGRAVGDFETVALNVGNRGVVCESRGEPERALAFHREAEDIARRAGNQLRAAVHLGNQANVHAQMGNFEASLACYREAEAMARELGAKQRIVDIVGNRGSVHASRGEAEEALACFREAEELARELGDQRHIALALRKRASLHARRGDTEAALRCYQDAERIAHDIGDRLLVARNMCQRGELHVTLKDLDEGWRALTAGIAMYDEMRANRSPWYFLFKASLAKLARDRGDQGAAKRLASEALDLAREIKLSDAHSDPAIRESLAALRALAQ
jgi:non-specific serine/threonine protein kinase